MEKIGKWIKWSLFPVLFVLAVWFLLKAQQNVNAGLAAVDAGQMDVARGHLDGVLSYTVLMFLDCLIMLVAFRFFLDSIMEALLQLIIPEEGDERAE